MARIALLIASSLLLVACGDGAQTDVPPPPPQALTDDELPDDLKGLRYARAPELTDEQLAEIEALESLGYVDGVRERPDVVSVTKYDVDAVFDGYNLVVSGHDTEASLIDMQGEVLHTWSHDYDALWPELDVPEDAAGRGKWRRAFLLADGALLAIHEGIGMIKLDRDSNLVWEYPGRAHHDAHVMPDGRIWTLTREAGIIPRISETVPSMDDFIVELSAEGEELRRVSVLEALEHGPNKISAELLSRMKRGKELFHTNSIEVLDGRLADRLPEFAAGNLLVSLRHLDAIAVIDPNAGALVWAMTGEFRAQHDPTILESGHLLLFDNRGGNDASVVREYDPVTRAEVWSYSGTPEVPFYSHTCGTSYRLPNGNTLVTESDGGRAFELTPDARIAWEFYNPHRGGPAGEYIAVIYDLQRVPTADAAWLER